MITLAILRSAMLGFGIFFSLHMAVFWARPQWHRLKVLNACCLLTLPVVVLIAWRGQPAELTVWDVRLLAMMLFGLLALGFMVFFGGVEHSVRMRMCIEIDRTPGRTVCWNELMALYSPTEIVENRIRQMAHGGYLIVEGDQVQLSAKGRLFARFALLGQKIYHLPPD
jgi:hypothetical protein